MAYKSKKYKDSSDVKARENIAIYYDDITMPGGYAHNLPETIKGIDLYYNSKFETGQFDSLGYRKFFYNIVKPACDIATKFIDLDTKDIFVVPEGSNDEIPAWFLEKKLKHYLKEKNFGVLLNEVGFDLPKYGTVVLKKSREGMKKVNLQNLRLDPAAKKMKYSSFVYELRQMSYGEIMEEGWDTEELFDRGQDEDYLIYECYERKGDKWKKTIYGDLFSTIINDAVNRSVESEINNQNDYVGAVILDEKEVDELPYRELHWEKIPGRWLGFGFVEYLKENQIAINEAENLERKGLLFTSLKLYQTRDESIGGSNILTNTQNGDILLVSSEITPLSMEERNLAAFNNTRQNWTANTERKTFTSDITTGASLPSRTPLGVANLQASFASSYFELKRENIGLFWKKVIYNDIIPDFEKDTAKEHMLMFSNSDKDIERLNMMITDGIISEYSLEYALKTGFFPNKEELEAERQRISNELKSKKNQFLKIEKNLYKNCKYYIDIVITGESVDNGTKSQVLQLALQIVGTNPAILQDPSSKAMLFSLLSLGGISPVELGLLDVQPQSQMQQMQSPQVAGSLASPQAIGGAIQGQQQL